jgi:DNA-binding IscR family transcriptional regulator
VQIGTRFSVAIHVLLCVEVFKETRKVTSDFIALSVNTNPVVIRKIMGQLREAGLIEVAAGTGGIELTRKAAKISLLDVYSAVESVKDGKLFKIHEDTAPGCPVGGNIEALLSGFFSDAQAELERKLASQNLGQLLLKLAELRGKRRAVGSGR